MLMEIPEFWFHGMNMFKSNSCNIILFYVLSKLVQLCVHFYN